MFQNKISREAEGGENVTVMITSANGVFLCIYRHYIALNVVLTSPSRQSLIDIIYAITGKERGGVERFSSEEKRKADESSFGSSVY